LARTPVALDPREIAMVHMSREHARSPRISLGPNYHRLWTATAISTLGDGIFATALPLLAATLSRDPLRVSLVSFSSWLPWLLFGLVAGALVDRLDRRQLMWTVDAARFGIVALLGVAVLAGWASIWLLAAGGFLLGVGATLFDNAATSLLPSLVGRDAARLDRANSQLYGTETAGQGLVGPPVGGLLFTLGRFLPFLADAVSFAASAALIAAVRGRFRPHRAAPAARGGLWAEIGEGLRWLAAHRLLRTLAIILALLNLAAMACEAVLVLFAQEELRLGSVGFGLLLTASAAGGLVGSVVAARLGRQLGTGRLLVTTILLNAGCYLAFGLSSNPWSAGVIWAVGGAVTGVSNVVGTSLRQTIVPDHLLGRVGSAYRMLAYSAVPVGALLGGVLGRTLGLRTPFLLAATVRVAVGLLALPVLNNRAVDAARLAGTAVQPPEPRA
jgi:MFS family permease